MAREPAGITLARRYLEMGRPQQTLETLSGIANPDLEDQELWYLRSAAELELASYSDAARTAREGLARSPSSIALLAILSAAESELGHAAEAERAILAALELSPDSPTLLVRYALLVAKAGQLEKAERLVDEAGRVDPADPDVTRARSVMAFLKGSDREAAEEARKVLGADPEDVAGLLMLGSTAAEAGRVDEAGRHFLGAARVEPHGPALEAAREIKIATHSLMWPLRPVERFGPGPVWIAAVATFVTLRILGYSTAALIAGVAWLLWCAYTWVVPPLVRRWVGWRGL
jgi:predicted Zn-dependent protease